MEQGGNGQQNLTPSQQKLVDKMEGRQHTPITGQVKRPPVNNLAARPSTSPFPPKLNNISTTPQQSTPTPPPQVQTSPPNEKPPKKGHKGLVVSIFILLILLLGGGAFLFAKGYISLPFLGKAPYTEQTFPQGVLSSFSRIKQANTSSTFDLSIPESGVDISTNATTYYIRRDDVESESRVVMTASVGNTFNMLDAEVRNINGKTYIKVNESDSEFLDLSSLRDIWIEVSANDFLVQVDQDNEYEGNEELGEQMEAVLEMLGREQVIGFKNKPVKVRRGDKTLFKYDLYIRGERIAPLYQSISLELSDRFPEYEELKFDQNVYDSLSEQSFLDTVEMLNDSSDLKVYVDSQGIVYAIELDMSLNLFEGQPVRVSFSYTIDDMEEVRLIDIPEDYVPFEEVGGSLFGLVGVSKLAQQKDNLQKLRQSLDIYRSTVGKYPESLEKLVVPLGEEAFDVPADEETDMTNQQGDLDSAKSEGLLSSIPLDVFTGQNFGYELVSEEEYRLTYSIYLNGFEDIVDKFENIDTVYIQDIPILGIRYVDGENTATNLVDSLEADTLNRVDADNDGLSDALEEYVGTDPQDPDTDKDEVSDGDELLQFMNPNGEGELK